MLTTKIFLVLGAALALSSLAAEPPGNDAGAEVNRLDTSARWANRGSHDANPKSILDSKIGADGVQLYKSDNHYRNFIDCVVSRKETAAPVDVAHRSITICHLGNIAMRLGRDSLKWDPATEHIIGDHEASKMLNRPHRDPWKLPRA